jgi:effector-binding domain-containing protein
MPDLSPEIVELDPQEAIAVRGDVVIAELPGFFERAFATVAAAVEVSGVQIVGPPFGFYPEMPAEIVAVEAGFPVSERVERLESAHRLLLPGGRVVQVVHVGPYETMEQTYVELQHWMSEHDLRPAVGMWECYLSDPRIEPDPATWRTRIIWPIT